MTDPGGSGLPPAGWEALLDAMEAGLDSFPPVLPDTLPTDPGPVPAALAGRARRTLARMADVAAVLEEQRAEIGRELAALTGAKGAGAATAPSVPHFLDTKA